MTEIKNVSQTQLTHTELAETANSYLTILTDYLSGNPFIMSLIAVITPAIENMRGALGAIRTNELVQRAFDLDEIRDSAFVFFRDLVAAYKKSDVEEEKEAYNQLWPIFEKVGIDLYSEGYLEQSARLEVLFQEFDKPQYQAPMATIGVTARYNRLKTSEGNFKTLYSMRLEEDVKKKYPTLREARQELSPLVADLLPTLRNVARTAKKNADLSWTDLINEQTDRVMTQVAARRTRRNAEDKEVTE